MTPTRVPHDRPKLRVANIRVNTSQIMVSCQLTKRRGKNSLELGLSWPMRGSFYSHGVYSISSPFLFKQFCCYSNYLKIKKKKTRQKSKCSAITYFIPDTSIQRFRRLIGAWFLELVKILQKHIVQRTILIPNLRHHQTKRKVLLLVQLLHRPQKILHVRILDYVLHHLRPGTEILRYPVVKERRRIFHSLDQRQSLLLNLHPEIIPVLHLRDHVRNPHLHYLRVFDKLDHVGLDGLDQVDQTLVCFEQPGRCLRL
jgi:hypothetical protein